MLSRNYPPELNHFSEVDHLIVRQALALLPKRQLKAITLRHWERLSETEISIAMNTDWRTVERIIRTAYERLKEICLSQPEFSRTLKKQFVERRAENQVEVSAYGN
jgi:DNA-directed RNA polymerase specialized sigma24 family protein